MKRLANGVHIIGITSIAVSAILRGADSGERPAWQTISEGLLEMVKGADPYKRVLDRTSCEQNNATLINGSGGIPGVRPGVVANCTDGRGQRCIICNPGFVGPRPANETVGTSQNYTYPPGLREPTSSSCGDMYEGRCMDMGTPGHPSYECINSSGTSVGTCADSIYWQLQADDV